MNGAVFLLCSQVVRNCSVYEHLVPLNALTTNVSLYSTRNPRIKFAFPIGP